MNLTEYLKRLSDAERIKLEKRFWSKIKITDSCWIWQSRIIVNGYGRFALNENHQVLAHRLAYELKVGPIPTGLTLDHLCRNRLCVNPSHLEAVTLKENIRRGTSHNGSKTHCPKGHALIEENIYYHKNGSRECKACKIIRRKEHRLRKKLLALSTVSHDQKTEEV